MPDLSIIQSIFSGIIQAILDVLSYTWWIILPVILLIIFFEYKKLHEKHVKFKAVKWVTLELRVPKENLKTPKAMEQIFAAAHSIVEPHLSFEIIGHSGGVHFFIRIPADNKNLIESAFFSQYPEAEMNEVEDYADFYPAVLPNEVYDVWGTELILAKDDPYPIQTYQYFEEREEEKRLDPLSNIAEVMSKLTEDETIWLQVLIRAGKDATKDFKKRGQALVDKLMGREKKDEGVTFTAHLYHWISNLILAPMLHPTWPGGKKSDETKAKKELTSGERDIIKAIENKLGKLAFETTIRFVYIDKKESFNKSNISAVMGAFKQFNTEHMNALKQDDKATTAVKNILAKISEAYKTKAEHKKKRHIFDAAKYRVMPVKTGIFSTEELATLYHIPTAAVAAPRIRRLEAKKGEPPAGLPIEEN